MLLLVFVALLTVATGDQTSIPGLPTDLKASDEQLSKESEQYAKQYSNEYVVFMKTGIESPRLRELTKHLLEFRSNESWAQGIYAVSTSDKFVACTACRATINVAVRMFRDPGGEFNGPNKEAEAKKAMLDICRRFKIQTEEVCAGIFDIHWPTFDFIIQNAAIDARSFCGTLPISFCGVKQPEYNWSLEVNNNDGINYDKPKAEKPLKGDGDITILQITDIHYDPEYQAGALADCEEPLCCQRMPKDEVPASELAGYWSDYHVCDSPWHMIENAFDQMGSAHTDIQYIYHTGDVIPHIGWKTSREGNKEIFTKIDSLMAEKFPGLKIFPCVGNHDAHPSDMFSPENVPEAVNIGWTYEHLYSLWSKHLPTETKATILKGGYYTVSPHSGFRIIALNNIDCYIYNWWLYYDGTYAIEQLQWLHNTLLDAEKAHEYVHILAHVPTGESDCWTVWSREYNRLIARFNHIISGIFNGHTHQDELNVHYTPKGNPVGVAWNGGSLTTFVGKNPNYRVYRVEQRTMQVVDFETWIFNLTEANQHGATKKPEWFKLCHFSEDFTDDLSPGGVDALLEKMAENPELLRKFWRCKMTASEPNLAAGCDNKCLMDTICALARTSFNQKERCRALQAKLKEHLPAETTTTNPPTAKPPGGDDGAATTLTLSLSFLLGISCLIRLLV